MTDPQATAQPIDGITTFAIEQAKAREEGRQQGLREAAEIARDIARVLRTNMDAFDPNAADQCDVLAEAIEATAGEKP